MHILLVNTNPVVSRLLSLHTRGNFTVDIDEIGAQEPIPRKRYDIVFVDEQCCRAEKIEKYLQNVNAGKKILLTSKSETQIDWVDGVIKKPFLPSEITAILISYLDSIGEEDEPLSSDEEEMSHPYDGSLSVLDREEIQKIQLLLQDENPPLDFESDTIARQHENSKEEEEIFESQLLGLLTKMKPKKIRKLLRGAEVSITIRFPKENER